MAQKITLYTTTQCAFCLMVKKFLDSKGKTYDVINLDEQPDQVAFVEEISGGRAVPVTVIQNDTEAPVIIRGWNSGQLTTALGSEK